MASARLDTLEQQNGGGHRCISPPPAPIIGGRDVESRVAASIQARLESVPPSHSECCIYRVPERLRKINEEAYTPLFVSIGPFHHGKESLKVQETLKWQHLRSFLGRNSEVTLSRYVKTIKEKEERIRKCYAEIMSVNSDEFVTMMVVDGCFILEFIYGFVYAASSTNAWFINAIGRDLILLENQLPLFVLEDLYKLKEGNNLAGLTSDIRSTLSLFDSGMLAAKEEQVLKENRNWSQIKELLDFVREGCSCSHGLPRAAPPPTETSSETSQKMHLLDFVRDNFIPPSSANNTSDNDASRVLNCTSLYPWNWSCFIPPSSPNNTLQLSSGNGNSEHDASRVLSSTSLYPWSWSCFIPSSSAANTSSSGNKKLQLPPNVTALHKAGVKLKVGGAGKNLLDVSFENGVLAIPCIIIEDSAESLLRNMIAFEQLYCVSPTYITDYATLLDSLIDTSKDVEMLQNQGIIKNSLGDHGEVSLLFNKLAKEIAVDNDKDFYFYSLCQDLNGYQRYWHAWIADLRQTYFNTPWTAISVIAAVVLIVLTILQTIYTIKSYIKQ